MAPPIDYVHNGPDERRISVRSIRVDGPRFADHQPSAHPAQWHDAKRRAIAEAQRRASACPLERLVGFNFLGGRRMTLCPEAT